MQSCPTAGSEGLLGGPAVTAKGWEGPWMLCHHPGTLQVWSQEGGRAENRSVRKRRSREAGASTHTRTLALLGALQLPVYKSGGALKAL